MLPSNIDPTNVKVEKSGGMKGDLGKDRWDLVYWPFLIGMVRVLTFGAVKYTDNNWKKLSRHRIEGALMRHWTEYKTEGKLDKETKMSHLFHMGCCLMFLCWFDDQNQKSYLVNPYTGAREELPNKYEEGEAYYK